MKYVEGQDRRQMTLLPDCLEDYIGEENPVRVFDAFVDGLDIEELGIDRAAANETGRPPYDPRDLLKLYIYGYFNRLRFSRRLMAECRRNVELFYLLGKLTPDFRTIADFRKNNAGALKNVFKAFVKLCMKLGLYQKELLAVDGSKFRAVNSKDNCYNAEILNKKLERIDVHIAEYAENEITEQARASTKPEDIRRCIAAGVLPRCYEGTAIEVELQGQTELSCFSLNGDGTVTCPTGRILTRLKTKGTGSVYASKEACRECANRCTGSGNRKGVRFGPNAQYVPVMMYGRKGQKLNPLPEGAVLYNSFHRKDKRKKQVILRIKEDPEKLHRRMCLSEHPFGTVKWYDGAHYLLCKGKEKAAAELGLSFLAYNLKRAINMVGTKAILAAIRG